MEFPLPPVGLLTWLWENAVALFTSQSLGPQDLAVVAAPAELISTRLEPGVDPIAEARRRGEILLIIRMGNIDLDAKGTPPLDAPSPFAAPRQLPPPVPSGPPSTEGISTGPVDSTEPAPFSASPIQGGIGPRPELP